MKLGIRASDASTTAEAMRCLQSSVFHAVFLDWFFADGTGEAVAVHLRDHWPQTLLVVTSADLSPDMVEHYRRSGAHHVLGKNYTLSDVRNALSVAPVFERPLDVAAPARAGPPPRLSSREHAACAQELHALRTAVADRHPADAARAAHNINGIARMLGLAPLAGISREVESAILAGEIPEARLADRERELGPGPA